MAERQRMICRSADLIDGGKGVLFTLQDGSLDVPAFVVRHQGKVFAYYNRCGHVPVELDWNAGHFFDSQGLYLICAVHGALYDPATGDCLGGPCNGRGLRPIAVSEQNGFIYLMQEG